MAFPGRAGAAQLGVGSCGHTFTSTRAVSLRFQRPGHKRRPSHPQREGWGEMPDHHNCVLGWNPGQPSPLFLETHGTPPGSDSPPTGSPQPPPLWDSRGLWARSRAICAMGWNPLVSRTGTMATALVLAAGPEGLAPCHSGYLGGQPGARQSIRVGGGGCGSRGALPSS